ncbi:TPA: hypothetical protein ENS27_15805 [bacterium]|nr:hypothetical protein [bacterium]
MTEPSLEITAEAIQYIKNEILVKIPSNIEDFTPENVDSLINNIYVLRYYCLKNGFDIKVTDRLDDLLETSQGLWDLLDSNSNTFMYLKEMYKIRGLDLSASLIGQYEEVTSGEESFRDVILSSIATYLGWKSDTIWVDVAKIDHFAPPKNHIRRIRNELWHIINESENGNPVSIEKASEISEKMSLLLQLMVSDEFPAVGRVLLISNIYALLLKLGIDKMIVTMESNGK